MLIVQIYTRMTISDTKLRSFYGKPYSRQTELTDFDGGDN